jgi:hypothetical protein
MSDSMSEEPPHDSRRPEGPASEPPLRVPRIVHFVYGFNVQTEPFHLLHYIALASCQRVLAPERIYFHCQHLPFGSYWDLIRPELTLIRVAPAAEVLAADYSSGRVPEPYRYAHHADVVRLDALIEHGGVYADIDTLFLRPIPDELFRSKFVIAEEGEVRDEVTGEWRRSLCNALMLAEPGSAFAGAWRARVRDALNGTWINHSCHLAQRVREELPGEVRVLPARAFFPVLCTPSDVARLLEAGDLDTEGSYSLHLWAHVWWDEWRQDFSKVHAGMFTPEYVRTADTALARLLRPYLPELETW